MNDLTVTPDEVEKAQVAFEAIVQAMKDAGRILEDQQKRIEALERFALLNQNHETRLRMLEREAMVGRGYVEIPLKRETPK